MELPLSYPDTFEECVALVLRSEGGYVDDRDNPGGATRFGISKRAFPKEDIVNLTEARARMIYLTHYWYPVKALPAHLRFVVFDAAVNCGVDKAVQILQRLCQTHVDGIVGPVTCAKAERVSVEAYLKEREKYYRGVVKNRPASAKFFSGWLTRLRHVRGWVLEGLRGGS